MSILGRLENSTLLAAVLAWLLASYVRFCFATTRWRVAGSGDLATALQDGPVIYVLWHSRVMYGPSAWPNDLARLFTLMDPSPVGRVASGAQARLGMEPISMRPGSSNFAASRQILKTIRAGHSIGIAADGPQGPALDAKQAAVEWARASQRPVYLFAWSARRSIRLKTWDNLMIPIPFSRGVYIHRRWPTPVARKLDPDAYARLRADLSDHLDQVMRVADQMAGVAAGP